MDATLGYLQHGKIKWVTFPPTVDHLTIDNRCPRCGRRNSFTGPFWCYSRLLDYYLCLCGVRYEPPDHSDQVGITDF